MTTDGEPFGAGVAEIALVQHGEKEPGPGDPGLTSRGREQALATAVHLMERDPVAVYASPLRRAGETADVIAGRLQLPVGTDERLAERINWVAGDYPDLETFLAEWDRTTTDRNYVPRHGDSSRAAAARLEQALRDYTARHPSGAVVVTSHGGVTIDLLRTLLGDENLRRRAPALLDTGVPPGAVTTLRPDPAGGWQVLGIAATEHLR